MSIKIARDRKIETQGPRKEKAVVDIIVIHAMSEYLINNEGEVTFAMDFLNDIQLGCHYFIAPDGLLIQGVEPEFKTPHVGRSSFRGRNWLNGTSIGIEFLVPGINSYTQFIDTLRNGDPFTDQQYHTGSNLVARLNREYGDPHLLGHDSVSGDDVRGKGRGKYDPGPNFNWSTFIEMIANSPYNKEPDVEENLDLYDKMMKDWEA